jgi:hypothetical protein
MSTSTLIAGPLSKMGRTELAQIPVPQATRTHRPVPHHQIVEALVETLSFRHIGVVNDEYAICRRHEDVRRPRPRDPDGVLPLFRRN